MKPSFLIVFLLMAWSLLDESEAWGRRRRWIRARDLVRIFCRNVCPVRCERVCPVCAPVCRRACKRVCSRKRNSVPVNATLPCDMNAWDENKDGNIDLEEFSSMAYPTVGTEGLPLAFEATDNDGNRRISKSELHKAEFLVGKC